MVDLHEAADGRFLLPDELSDELSDPWVARKCYASSEKFWLKYWDVLPEGVGIIYQQVEAPKFAQNPLTTTLLFDARRRINHQFTWQVTDASTCGRSIWQFESNLSGNAARLFEIDPQGRLMNQRPLAAQEVALLKARIFSLADGSETAVSVNLLRIQKLKLEQALAIYSVSEIFRHNKIKQENFSTELENRQNAVDKTGFTPGALYRPSAEVIGRIITLSA